MTETVGKWVLVPAEPTEGMIVAVNQKEHEIGITELGKSANPSLRLHYSVAYSAMLAAAPPAPDVVGVLENVEAFMTIVEPRSHKAECVWIDCWNCGGEGYLEGDCTCMEDTCCCLEPDPPVCDVCKGKGGWFEADQ